jgi:hypothetical protein
MTGFSFRVFFGIAHPPELLPMTWGLVVNLLVLTLMTIMNPVQYQVVSLNFDQYDRAIETAGYCNIKGSMEFVIPLA